MPQSPDSLPEVEPVSPPETAPVLNAEALPLNPVVLLELYQAKAAEAVRNILPLMADPSRWGWLGMYLTTLNAAHTAHRMAIEKADSSGVKADRLGEAVISYMLFLSAVAEQSQPQEEALKD